MWGYWREVGGQLSARSGQLICKIERRLKADCGPLPFSFE